MVGLIAVLWAVYLTECFVRWRPGDWIFRRVAAGAARAVHEPDITLARERFGFVWASLLPWSVACLCRGAALDLSGSPFTRLRSDLRWVRAFAALLFGVVLIVFPALVLAGRLLPWLWMFAAALSVTWAATFVAFWIAYRRVHGHRPALETWLVLALSPVGLMRAPLVVALHAAPATHPVAAAHALCDDREFLRAARLWSYDSPDLRPAIERLAAERGLSADLTSPPDHPEPGVALFCPRCHATFTAAATTCADCAVGLAPLGV